ncbi:MAG: RNA polymerase sigma factor [Deltaproteobacteria bacterium]|nr:RNA polymerase sigma factor [Deltaproteobacteria bacterium]
MPTPTEWSAAYRQHFAAVWSALVRLGVPRGDLEDAVQDVFLVAHRRRDVFAGDSSVRTWLLGISRRVAADHRRGRRRHHRRVEALGREHVPPLEPDDILRRMRGAELVQRFLDSLDDGKREVFVLVELHEMTGREAAQVLALNRNTAVARLRAARQAFDRYARRCRRPPQRMLAAAHRESQPDPSTRTRVLGLLMVRLGGTPGAVATATTAPIGVAGLGVGTVVKSIALSVTIAAAGLAALAAVAPGSSSAGAPATTHAVSPPPEPVVAMASAVPEVQQGEPVPHPVPRPVVAPVVRPVDAAAPVGPEVASDNTTRSATPRPPTRSTRADVDPLAVHSLALRQARAALGDGQPDRALAIVRDATASHPGGALVRELQVVRVEALCAQGRHQQARGEARRLRSRYRGSPVVARARCPEPIAD